MDGKEREMHQIITFARKIKTKVGRTFCRKPSRRNTKDRLTNVTSSYLHPQSLPHKEGPILMEILVRYRPKTDTALY